MKVAIIGSRNLVISHLEQYLPPDATEIVSGGAVGIDTCARMYAKSHDLLLTEFFPNYKAYGKSAPLKRNIEIIKYSDIVLAFWDGESRGTKHVIENCRQLHVPVKVYIVKNKSKRN